MQEKATSFAALRFEPPKAEWGIIMKNAGRIGYIVLCLLVCAVPFAGMAVHASNTTTENKELASFPDVKKNGKWNMDFMQELGKYFEDHFAFRAELVTADAKIQSNVFGVSNADTVTVGTDGWLYYTATVNDYLGQDVMSRRKIANAVHNLSLVQQYVQENGAAFLLTIPPNKNSLYGENMPYYFQKKAGSVQNIDLLKEEIIKKDISYTDLFSLFEEQKEVLYLKRDSHWNNKGAVLAYDALLSQLKVKHDRYETTKNLRLKEEYGDLNKMLYPLAAEPEWNYSYQKEDIFSYKTDTKSVEDAWIETENSKGNGSLLMFRDSFGNTLLPLMANTFAEGYFSKGVPQNIAGYMGMYQPDVVILEKVERNISEFAEEPPLIECPVTEIADQMERVNTETSLNMTESENNANYWEISGSLEDSICKKNIKIYVKVTDGEEQKIYETLSVTNNDTDYGYRLYLSKEKLSTDKVGVEVIVEDGKKYQIVKSAQIDVKN